MSLERTEFTVVSKGKRKGNTCSWTYSVIVQGQQQFKNMLSLS